MSRTVLFIDGPLRGTTRVLPGAGMVPLVYAHNPEACRNLDDRLPEPVAYNLSRFAFCKRIIWIGHLSGTPDDDLAFDLLASDAAKGAVDVPEAVR